MAILMQVGILHNNAPTKYPRLPDRGYLHEISN
jgi:hypothetical protein